MHMTTKRVAVAGASGYAGGEVLRLLLGHPEVEIGALTGASNAGRAAGRAPAAPGAARRPGARADHARRRSPGTTWSSSRSRTASPARSPPQLGDDTVVIDCGADFRLDRRRAPGSGSTAATHAGTWPYGLPELPGQRDAAARAPPGSPCPAATRPSSTLALAPAVAAGLVEPDVVVVAASGTSGAGKAAKPHLLGSEVMGNASAYGVGGVAPAHPGDHPEPRRR